MSFIFHIFIFKTILSWAKTHAYSNHFNLNRYVVPLHLFRDNFSFELKKRKIRNPKLDKPLFEVADYTKGENCFFSIFAKQQNCFYDQIWLRHQVFIWSKAQVLNPTTNILKRQMFFIQLYLEIAIKQLTDLFLTPWKGHIFAKKNISDTVEAT